MRKKILIVEDDLGIREMTKKYLTQKGFHVLVAGNATEALEHVQKTPPDLVLLDIELPGKTGYDICQEIRKTMQVPIIFLSVRRGVNDKVKSFELGADDYVTKPFKFIELEARINANLRRYQSELPHPKNVIKHGDLEINVESYTCHLNGKLVPLSTKEMQLLILLAKSPNQVWSHEQLYQQIWDEYASQDIRTVKVHISKLRSKLEENPTKPRYIKTVRGFGYRFKTDDSVALL